MITPIRKLGSVILRLPDLPPLRCCVEWTDSYNAGLSFEVALSAPELSAWVQSRRGETMLLPTEAVIDEAAEAALCA